MDTGPLSVGWNNLQWNPFIYKAIFFGAPYPPRLWLVGAHLVLNHVFITAHGSLFCSQSIERPVETEGANWAAFVSQAFTSPNGSPRINMETLEKGTLLKGNFIIQPSIFDLYASFHGDNALMRVFGMLFSLNNYCRYLIFIFSVGKLSFYNHTGGSL